MNIKDIVTILSILIGFVLFLCLIFVSNLGEGTQLWVGLSAFLFILIPIIDTFERK